MTDQQSTSDPMSDLNQIVEPTQETRLDKEVLKGCLEAILFFFFLPVSIREMADMLEVVPDAVETLLDDLDNQYRQSSRGIFIIRLEDKIQLATKVE